MAAMHLMAARAVLPGGAPGPSRSAPGVPPSVHSRWFAALSGLAVVSLHHQQ